MRMLGALAPGAPPNDDLDAASRALHAGMMAESRIDLRRWQYAPATTVHRMVGDGVTVFEPDDLVDDCTAV